MQLGVGGIFAVLVIKEVLPLVGKSNGKNGLPSAHCLNCNKILEKLADNGNRQILLLSNIHNVIDNHEQRTADRVVVLKDSFSEVKECLHDIKKALSNGRSQP